MEKNIQKSWSQLTIKNYNEEQRIITGIASTPDLDRDGDKVNSKGAKFKLPFPLLAGHSHDHPVGEVTKATVTRNGIEIEAKIFKDTGLDYVERTWKQVKSKLIRGLSIGFRGIDIEKIASGLHFKTFEVLELSLVVVPSNQNSSIQAIKHYCNASCKQKSADLNKRRANIIKRAAACMIDKSNKGS